MNRRMYLSVYVPKLQREQDVVGFLRQHRGQPLPSAALMSPISRAFVSELEGFAANNEIPLVRFRKGERKDDVMAEHLRRFDKDEGVVFVGKAQEKTPVFRDVEAPQSDHRSTLSADRARKRNGKLILHLSGGPRFWAVLSQVLHDRSHNHHTTRRSETKPR
jgi:hypothetical protein